MQFEVRHINKTYVKANYPSFDSSDLDGMPDRLEQVLEALDLTDREAAGLAGVSERVINNWRKDAPGQLKRLMQICSAHNIDVLWLLTGQPMFELQHPKYTPEELDLACRVLRDGLAEIS